MNNPELNALLARYLLKCSEQYFCYSIKSHNQDRFEEVMKLAKGLPFDLPKVGGQKELMLFLQSQENEEVTKRIVEIINTQILIDKKDAKSNSLCLNKFFGSFVCKNYGLIFPQLERLIVRSSGNIDVWLEFFRSISPLSSFDPCLLYTSPSPRDKRQSRMPSSA